MPTFLHIAARAPNDRVWVPDFVDALREIGELTIVQNGDDLSDDECLARMHEYDVLITGWGARAVPVRLAQEPGCVRYICNVTGSVQKCIPIEIVEAGIPVTNWGDAPAGRLAEGAMALLLANVKNMRLRIETVARGEWRFPTDTFTGILEGMDVGVYGCGAIGRRFVEMLRPFDAVVRVFDPYAADVPEGSIRVDSLDELFDQSHAVVIHAGLSEETRGSVTAELLAKLPDKGIVVNTARGAIVDQDALFVELEKGRLLAGLDVLDPDRLPDDHPARQWPNVAFTCHDIGKASPGGNKLPKTMQKMHRVCLANLARYVRGEPLEFVMDRERYLRST